MVAKSLDDIVLDANVRERIRPYFERALAAGDFSFEHTWWEEKVTDSYILAFLEVEQGLHPAYTHEWWWQFYCELLDAVAIAMDTFRETITAKSRATGEDVRVAYVSHYGENRFTKYNQGVCVSKHGDVISIIAEDIIRSLPEYMLMMTAHKPYVPRVFSVSLTAFFSSPTYEFEEGYYCFEHTNLFLHLSNWFQIFKSADEKLLARVASSFPSFLLNPYTCTVLTELGHLSPEEDSKLSAVLSKFPLSEFGYVLDAFRSNRTASAETIGCACVRVPNHRVISKIGEGSGRVVYKAWDEKDECFVAVKVAKLEGTTDSSNRKAQEERYGHAGLAQKEGKVARQLTHPNLARYFGRGTLHDGRPYVIEEYVDGVTLAQFIQKNGSSVRSPTVNRSMVISHILSGAAFLHQHLYVHRDITTNNILVPTHVSDLNPVRLGDLELARDIGNLVLAKAMPSSVPSPHIDFSHGARAYTAPELLEQRGLSFASDVFSLGIVMYELFTGRHPFRTGRKDDKVGIVRNICNPAFYARLKGKIQNSADVPPYYKPIITQCLEYDPSERYTSAEDIVHAIYRLEQRRQRYRRYRTRR